MPHAAPLILAIETSCDETAVALADGAGRIIASQVASQTAVHAPYGGVVPEVASRNHLGKLRPLLERVLDEAGARMGEIDAFAATAGPGLASSLMLGLSVAKGLAIGAKRPFLAINHLEGHLLSPFIDSSAGIEPAMGLVVSGGHTLLVEIEGFQRYAVLGRTRDDAAGEAFDKVGKLLALPYPGGPQIDRLARFGDRAVFNFPRSMLHSGDDDFSFSGLKTAVRYTLPKAPEHRVADVCASFQEAVVDVLVQKTLTAARRTKKRTIALSGGVSCNTRLRERFAHDSAAAGLRLMIADSRWSTDNAGMIAFVAVQHFHRGESSPLGTDIDPNLRLG